MYTMISTTPSHCLNSYSDRIMAKATPVPTKVAGMMT